MKKSTYDLDMIVRCVESGGVTDTTRGEGCMTSSSNGDVDVYNTKQESMRVYLVVTDKNMSTKPWVRSLLGYNWLQPGFYEVKLLRRIGLGGYPDGQPHTLLFN